jgi:tyrosyl-tRNA synthetase
MSDLIKELNDRGYIHQGTNLEGLSTCEDMVGGYIGFDCTAKALHVGSLLQIMLLRKIQQHGYKPFVLMGGGTTQIGDPSGKDESRKLLTKNEIDDNKQSISTIFSKYLRFDDSADGAVMVDNADWLDKLHYIEVLRDIGRHFSINRMLSFDSVRMRLQREQNLTFLEFNYMILQAYDFVELYNRFGCRLQLGGSDQWGNIVSGVELGRRMGTAELFGLTSPLITTSSGAKMGKTAKGAVWLDEKMLSPYEYWQFWRNTDDADVTKFLKLFTEVPLSDIDQLSKLSGREINDAKVLLANEITALCHGKEAAEAAYKTALSTFMDKDMGEDLPAYVIPRVELGEGLPMFKLLANLGVVESGGAARRLIQGGGVRLNNQVVVDEMLIIDSERLLANGIKVSLGKKNHMIIKVEEH